MRNLLSLTIILCFIATAQVEAHVTNEKNLYEDIEYSAAREDIMLLRALNAISPEEGVNLFRPQEVLTKKTLAVWALNFRIKTNTLKDDHGSTNISPEMAVNEGIVDNLQGNATYEDVNTAYFNGDLNISINKEITREEFAIFLGEHFLTRVDDKDMFERSGLSEGPSGKIEHAEALTEGGVGILIIDGLEYMLSLHPKIINGPSDVESLKNFTISESYMSKNEKGEVVIEVIKMALDEEKKAEIVKEEVLALTNTSEDEKADKTNNNLYLFLLSVPLVIILFWLIFMPNSKKI